MSTETDAVREGGPVTAGVEPDRLQRAYQKAEFAGGQIDLARRCLAQAEDDLYEALTNIRLLLEERATPSEQPSVESSVAPREPGEGTP